MAVFVTVAWAGSGEGGGFIRGDLGSCGFSNVVDLGLLSGFMVSFDVAWLVVSAPFSPGLLVLLLGRLVSLGVLW